MVLVWTGILLIVLKLLQVGPLADLSWWWILTPLAAAFVWFELLESKFGFDRSRADQTEWQQGRKKRIADTLGLDKRAKGGAKLPKS